MKIEPNLLFIVRVICNVAKLFHLRRTYLLILADNIITFPFIIHSPILVHIHTHAYTNAQRLLRRQKQM